MADQASGISDPSTASGGGYRGFPVRNEEEWRSWLFSVKTWAAEDSSPPTLHWLTTTLSWEKKQKTNSFLVVLSTRSLTLARALAALGNEDGWWAPRWAGLLEAEEIMWVRSHLLGPRARCADAFGLKAQGALAAPWREMASYCCCVKAFGSSRKLGNLVATWRRGQTGRADVLISFRRTS